MFKRLAQPSGIVADQEAREGDSDEKVVRPAILVHSGPNGSPVEFQSGDGPISFDEERIKRIVANHNAKIEKLAAGYGGVDKMPIGAFPPILDQHEDDSSHRIGGRLAALLRFEKRDVPGVGENVACAVTDLTFLGKDTCLRVKDGRIYHLSIGIDEATDTLGETSTVIEPAAPGAMLLNRRQTPTQGVKKMPKQIARLKAHTARMALLTGAKETLTSLTSKLSESEGVFRQDRAEGEVRSRLTRLMAAKKLTPAEAKSFDIKRLAKLDKESLDTVLSTFEKRQDVIMSGQRGTSDAIDASDVTKNLERRQTVRLKSEIRGDLKRLGAKLKDDPAADQDHGKGHEMSALSGPKEYDVQPGKDEHAVPGEGGDLPVGSPELKRHMAALKHHLESGEHDKAMAAYGAMEKCMSSKHLAEGGFSDVKSEDHQKSMDGVQHQLDEMKTQMARLAGVVNELFDAEEEEGHDLEKEEDEHAE